MDNKVLPLVSILIVIKNILVINQWNVALNHCFASLSSILLLNQQQIQSSILCPLSSMSSLKRTLSFFCFACMELDLRTIRFMDNDIGILWNNLYPTIT